MTDRYNAFIVTLDREIRSDDAEEGILTALRMLKGVISVEPVVASLESYIAREQARRELIGKIYDVLK